MPIDAASATLPRPMPLDRARAARDPDPPVRRAPAGRWQDALFERLTQFFALFVLATLVAILIALALGLGIVVLGETLSFAQFLGLPIVLAGCWLAAARTDTGPVLVAEP